MFFGLDRFYIPKPYNLNPWTLNPKRAGLRVDLDNHCVGLRGSTGFSAAVVTIVVAFWIPSISQ